MVKVFQGEEPWAQIQSGSAGLLENRLNVSALDSGEEEVNVHPDLTVGPNRRRRKRGRKRKRSGLTVIKCIFPPSPNTDSIIHKCNSNLGWFSLLRSFLA